MSFTKNIFALLSLAVLIGFSSCKDDCVAPDIATNIIGTWETVLVAGEVEFRSDGTYRDDDAVLFGINENLPDDIKTYTLTGNDLELMLEAADGSASGSVIFTVTQNECDQIKLTIIGISETLNRKD